MQTQILPVGEQLRAWRGRRRLSQLDLALDAEISARHLSFLETGRSRPSRAMLLRLAERLDIPARDRNLLLVAAGFAPALPERSLDDPALAAARRAVDLVLKAHEPFPGARRRPPLADGRRQCRRRAACSPASPRICSRRRSTCCGSASIPKAWRRASSTWPNGAPISSTGSRRRSRRAPTRCWPICSPSCAPIPAAPRRAADAYGGVAVPLVLRAGEAELSFLSTTTMFGTPIDITLSELAIEAFLPADARTAEFYLMG